MTDQSNLTPEEHMARFEEMFDDFFCMATVVQGENEEEKQARKERIENYNADQIVAQQAKAAEIVAAAESDETQVDSITVHAQTTSITISDTQFFVQGDNLSLADKPAVLVPAPETIKAFITSKVDTSADFSQYISDGLRKKWDTYQDWLDSEDES